LPCDYIGFHTYDYARHFLSACNRVLNLPTMPNAVQYKGRTVNIGTIPIGIDPEKFAEVISPYIVRFPLFGGNFYLGWGIDMTGIGETRVQGTDC
jgi:hypothetical protein